MTRIDDGHRVTMAATGYFHDGKPLLYDRGTRSLWVEDKDSLTAIAGKHKRAKAGSRRQCRSGDMENVAQPEPGEPAFGRRGSRAAAFPPR